MARTTSFFSKHPNIGTDPTMKTTRDFNRLARQRGWDPDSTVWKLHWNDFISAKLDGLFGGRDKDLKTWQEVCGKLGLRGDFSSFNKCKKALARVNANIVDLLECWATGKRPRMFRSREELEHYTKVHRKFFPRSHAKQSRILRIFLKNMA
ncbi:hypothetical protein N7474_004497 [Penicillium riverlandense]|uniref:uncharacterized protein n=1 Tax=Penicillium riverlandense TaxID=1903569 RepID=UPI0025475DA2|nr:uncharacterized protein N7474_004497 [Penicillium riverlandense]KAJ5818906.1 hypothetical protein N7474_004497 [Penicillium riverlandense]